MKTVIVDVSDLEALADIVCERDATKSTSPESIQKAHDLIIKMLGDQVGQVYAQESA